jgi:hypothetical protein
VTAPFLCSQPSDIPWPSEQDQCPSWGPARRPAAQLSDLAMDFVPCPHHSSFIGSSCTSAPPSLLPPPGPTCFAFCLGHPSLGDGGQLGYLLSCHLIRPGTSAYKKAPLPQHTHLLHFPYGSQYYLNYLYGLQIRLISDFFFARQCKAFRECGRRWGLTLFVAVCPTPEQCLAHRRN